MKKGWEVRPLGTVIVFAGGGTPSKGVARYWIGDIPWVSPKDVKLDVIYDSEDHVNLEAVENSATKLLPRDSILVVTRSGILARTVPIAIAGRDLTVNQDLKALLPSKKCDPKFLFYFLKAREANLLEKVTRGATVHRIATDDIRHLALPLPPLPEQKRIVEVLDKAFEGLAAAKANAEANLQNARELFESIKADALASHGAGSAEVQLADVATIESSLVDPRGAAYGDLPHVGAGNMISDSDEIIDVKTAKEEGLISGKYLFETGVVLYSKIRPYLRKVVRPEFRGLCSADVYPLVADKRMLDRDFLYHLLLGERFTQYAIKGSDRAGMPKVNREHLFGFRFRLPSVTVQKQVVEKIETAFAARARLEATWRNKSSDIDHLKQSLLQKAFAGELT